MAVPAVHALRRAYPEHRLVLAVPGWLAEVVELVGGVDALLPTAGLDHPLPVAPGRVDVAADLHGGPASTALLAALRPRRRIAHRGTASSSGTGPWRSPAGPAWARTPCCAGRLGRLGELAALIHAAALVVSADTGAAHLASAYAVPSVVLFGPAPPEEWGPPAGGPHVVLTDARARRGDTFAATPDPALLAVTAADVLAAARALLRPAPSRQPAGG